VSSRAHIIRYLESRLSACRAWPALHRHQIAAYERLLDLARGALDAADYYRELHARELTLIAVRAEWLDRYHGAACIYGALGDEAQRGAAAARFHAGQQRDFLAAITAEQRSAGRIAAARTSQDALAPLLMSLLDWRIEADAGQREHRLGEVRGLWGVIRDADPGCTWERICSYPPYRNRIPFDDTGLVLLGDWLALALAGAVEAPETASGAAEPGDHAEPNEHAEHAEPDEHAEPGEPPAAPAAAPAPTARALAHAYHVIYEAQDWTGRDATRQVYERILALEAEVERQDGGDGDAFLRRMAEEDLFTHLARAPHLDWAEDLRAHGAGRSQSTMTHHASVMATAMAACPTPTAVEYERWLLDACFDVESAWDQILVHYALRPLAAVLASAPGVGATVREGIAAQAALFGTTWDALLATPRLRDFICRDLVPAMFGQQPLIGARRGEVGSAVVQAAALATSRPASDAPADVRAYLAALMTTAVGTPATAAPAGGRALVLWGQPVALDDLADRLAAPPRPAIALDAAGATAMSALSHP
jgi:hypothetical protein